MNASGCSHGGPGLGSIGSHHDMDLILAAPESEFLIVGAAVTVPGPEPRGQWTFGPGPGPGAVPAAQNL